MQMPGNHSLSSLPLSFIPLSSLSLCASPLLYASPALSVSPAVFLVHVVVSSPAPDAHAPETHAYKTELAEQATLLFVMGHVNACSFPPIFNTRRKCN